MSTEGNQEPTAYCGQCVAAIAALISLPFLFEWAGRQAFSIELARIDWQAMGAIASAVAAIAAAFAARTALAIDARAAERAQARELREAIPLAFAMQRELNQAWGLAEQLIVTERDFPPTGDSLALVHDLAQLKDQFSAQVAEESLRNLGCFDAETGAALGTAVASLHALRQALSLPALPAQNVSLYVLAKFVFMAEFARQECWNAANVLTKYTNVPIGPLERIAHLGN